MPQKPNTSDRDVNPNMFSPGFIRSISIRTDRSPNLNAYPFTIPAVRKLETLAIHPKVTFIIGENGSGKSTLIEAIAVVSGYNAEGGSKNFNFATRRSESALCDCLQITRGIKREEAGFFLRAESFFNVATEIEALGMDKKRYYGGKSMHEQSHGESFMALATHRFWPNGLYILDEPEAALSPIRQMSLLQIIHRHVVHSGSQFIIATHSPILMAYPDCTMYELSSKGIHATTYEQTEHFQVTRDFLAHHEEYMRALMEEAVTGD